VLYLTPDAPLSGGTGFYKHKATGLLEPTKPGEDAAWDNQAQDVTKWELVSSVGNVYNRLILYKGSQFHTSMDYFGNDLYTGRLFQTFFFNTQR
jgi:ABC-type Fe3+ transport system substrate-binding protein